MDAKTRVSGEAWARILVEQAASGQSAIHFCRERGIRPSSFFSAKKRERLAQSPSGLAELPSGQASRPARRRSGIVSHSAQGSTFLSVKMSDEVVTASCTGSAIRVQLRSGHQLWVESEFDSAHLSRLVAVLDPAS